jgi:hypothetical protein
MERPCSCRRTPAARAPLSVPAGVVGTTPPTLVERDIDVDRLRADGAVHDVTRRPPREPPNEARDAMKDIIEQLDKWVERGDSVAIATVVDFRRSAPRPPGSKMLINDRGEVYGAISGGCVEGAVVEVAQGVLAGAPAQLCSYGIADNEAWDVGLPCGGEIDVWIEHYEP